MNQQQTQLQAFTKVVPHLGSTFKLTKTMSVPQMLKDAAQAYDRMHRPHPRLSLWPRGINYDVFVLVQGKLYPLKPLWSIATNRKLSSFNTHQAIRAVKPHMPIARVKYESWKGADY